MDSNEILSNLCKSFEDVASEMNDSADAQESADIRSESFIFKRMKNFKYINYSKVFQFRKHRKPRYLRRFK